MYSHLVSLDNLVSLTSAKAIGGPLCLTTLATAEDKVSTASPISGSAGLVGWNDKSGLSVSRARLYRVIASACAIPDLICACIIMVWMVLAHPIQSHELEIARVLALRISVINCLIAVGC